MEDLIPIREAAKEFGIHRVTLHRYIRVGLLKAHRRRGFDRRTYVDRNEIRRFLEFADEGERR